MTSQPGYLLLLKIGNGGAPESFTTVGGLRTTAFAYNAEPPDATHRESGPWRQLMDGAGARSLTLSATGWFTDSTAEETLRAAAMGSQVRNYQLTFANGDVISGPFAVTAYRRAGDYDAEETYALSLASAGEIAFAAG